MTSHKDLLPKDLSIERDFPDVIDVDVAWGEMDSFGHVNNIVFFRYFESVRMTFLTRIGFAKAEDNNGVGPILASTECVFRRPLQFPDRVRVGTRVRSMERDRFTMDYQVFSTSQNAIAAWGIGIVVAFDYNKQAKAEIPAEVVSRITLSNDERVARLDP